MNLLKWFVALFFTLSLFLLGCEAPVSFLQEDEGGLISVTSLDSGEMVSEKTAVPLSLSYDTKQVQLSKLDIVLKDAAGKVLAKETLEGEDILPGTLPSINLPELKTGQYLLQYLFYSEDDKENVTFKKEIPFFYVEGTYSLTGITSYPPVVSPKSAALLEAQIVSPVNADPYLRWAMGDSVIREGYASDGLRTIQWISPVTEGVYSITAELFPVKPEGLTYIASPLRIKAEIFVTSSDKPGKNEYEPSASYATLLHFRGDLKDFGYAPQTVSVLGNPVLDVKGNTFGYSMMGKDGFRFERMAVPVREDMLQPCTLEFRLLSTMLGKEQALFFTQSKDNGFQFYLAVGPAGEAVIRIAGEDIDWETVSGPGWVTVNDALNLAVSLKPTAENLSIAVFRNGIVFHRALLQGVFSVPQPEGITIIGGPTPTSEASGFNGVLDEFGIYNLDESGRISSNPGLYKKAMKDEYGSRLIYAEGFSGTYLPAQTRAEGGAYTENDSCALQSEATLFVPGIALNHETLEFEIVMAADNKAGLISLDLMDKENRPVSFIVNSRGVITLPTGKEQAFSAEGNLYKFQASHIENTLQIIWKDGSFSLELPNETSEINLRVSNSAKEGIVYVDSVLVLSKNQNIARTGTPPTKAEGRGAEKPQENADLESPVIESALHADVKQEGIIGNSAGKDTLSRDHVPQTIPAVGPVEKIKT